MDVEKYIKHAVESPMMREDTQGMSCGEILSKFKNRAVCPRCEKWAYRDKGWQNGQVACCPACGWRGKTITMDEFITNRLYH